MPGYVVKITSPMEMTLFTSLTVCLTRQKPWEVSIMIAWWKSSEFHQPVRH